MTINQKVAVIVSGTALAFTLGLAKTVRAAEFNPQGWPISNVNTAKFIGEKQKDILPSIPGNETTLRIYRTPEGTYFNTLSVGDRLYGFYVDTDGKPPMEYTLVDQDGDGVFRYKYTHPEEAPDPKYLLR